MYSYGSPHMAEQKQDDQLEYTYSSYVRIRDVALKTCQRQWTIGGSDKRGSGISVLAARHDGDNVDDEDPIGCYHSGPESGSNANKEIICKFKSSSITGTSLSDCFVSYLGHSLGEYYLLQRSSLCILRPKPMVGFFGFFV